MERLTSLRLGVVAVVAGTLLFGAERFWIIALADGRALSGRAALAWWAVNVTIALIFALLGAISHVVSQRVADDRRFRQIALRGLLVGLGAAALALPLGGGLVTGGWIAQQPWGWLMRFVPAVLCFGVGAVVAAAATSLAHRGKLSFASGVALVACGVAMVGVDHMILLGIYPDIHLTLHLVSVLTLVAGVGVMPWRLRRTPSRVVGVVALLVALATPALWLTLPLGYRPHLSMTSSMANVLMELTMPRIELQFAEREFANVDPTAGTYLMDRSGDRLAHNDWNVLWITVDTLRWDALWPERPAAGNDFADADATPFLDQWMKSAVVFDRAYAQSSATHRSMPPMFKSLEAYEPTLELGTPLGTAAARTGRTSIAVVNNFFLEPRYKRSQSLLWGFDVVEIYHKKRQEELVTLIDGALERHGDDRFFAWLHFYNMHAPGYGADGLQTSKGTTWPGRYKISLRWLDEQMAKVIGNLERRGLADNTIVVFSADHGESLGANRQNAHGPTVYEEEIRVPLAIRIPGVAHRRVATTVGNIDIVPTLWDALAVEAPPTFRGRSLLAAMLGNPLTDTPYYVENASGQIIGVVLGTQKLIQKRKSGTTMRFDLEADPTEDENLFEDGPQDHPLLAAMYAKNPNLVKATPMMGEVARSLLESMKANRPGASLRYVLHIAARSEIDVAREAMVKLFGRTRHDRVKLEVLSALLDVDAGAAVDLARRELDGIDVTREARFVEGLAAIGVGGFDPAEVERRFERESLSDDIAMAWVQWMLTWEKPAVGPALVLLVERLRARDNASPLLIGSVAELIAAARLDADEVEPLTRFNRELLGHHSVRVQVHAIETAGKFRDAEAFAAIEGLVASGAIRVRQAALHALAAIDPERSVDLIVEAGADENLVLDAVRALQATRSERAIPYVRKVWKTHYNSIIRSHAGTALKKLKAAN